MRRLSTFLVLLVAVAAASTALAKPKEADLKKAAGALLEEGNQLFEAGNYEGALGRYQGAYDTYPSPKIYLNLGKAHQKLGNVLEAERFLELFQKQAGVPERSPSYRDSEERLRAVRASIGEVALTANVFGAEVFVDGKSACVSPCEPVRVVAGRHEVVAQKPGYSTFQRVIEVKGGAKEAVEVTLVALAAAKPKLESPPRPPPKIAVVERPPPAAADDDNVLTEWWFWTALGIAAGTAVAVSVALTAGGEEEFVPRTELGVTPTDQWGRR